MARWVILLLLVAVSRRKLPPRAAAGAASREFEKPARPAQPPSPDNGQYALPAEEDKSLTKENYSFNPLQSKKDVTVGNEYFKAGNYKAAEWRFRDATRWNGQNSEAWRRLGDAAEKQKDAATVKEAYTQYLKVSPDAKDADEIRKKLAKLK